MLIDELFNKNNYKIIEGDSLETIKNLPDNSVNCCVTSPPYYGQRDYGTGKWVGGDPNCPHRRLNKHSDKITTGHAQEELRGNVGDAIYKTVCPLCGAIREDKQIGLEETPEEYIDKLVALFREVKRVLKNDGTLWINIGDSYFYSIKTVDGLKNKDLIGIPWMLAFALRKDGWYLRQDIIWEKPNPMPEGVDDRCTKSHEYIFLLSKSQKYYFDVEAIEEPANYDGRNDITSKGSDKYSNYSYLPNQNVQSFASGEHERWKFKSMPKFGGDKYDESEDGQQLNSFNISMANGIPDTLYAVRRKRDVWRVTTSRYKEAHFATFPEDLVEPMLLAGCPKGGVVLDPFSGSGTTGVVALSQNKKYIGLELNKKYIDLSIKRIEESLGNHVSVIQEECGSESKEIIGRESLWS